MVHYWSTFENISKRYVNYNNFLAVPTLEHASGTFLGFSTSILHSLIITLMLHYSHYLTEHDVRGLLYSSWTPHMTALFKGIEQSEDR